MAIKKNDSQAARDERARQLREQVESLKSGTPIPKPSKRKKSIREQVEEASRKRGGKS